MDALNQVVVTHIGDSFEVGTETQTPERRLAHANGTIDSSLFLAAGKAGLLLAVAPGYATAVWPASARAP